MTETAARTTGPTRSHRTLRVRPRLRALAHAALRVWFAFAGRVAPRVAERHAASLILTPARRRPRAPEVPGLVARTFTLDVDGRALAAWSWGEGPTVLLVHGWNGRAADMSALAGAFARAGYRAVAVDMPAHGASPGRRTSLADWTPLLVALGDALGTPGVGLHAIVGHSFGAAAVTLALELGLRARGAVLVAPARGPAHFLDQARRAMNLPAERAHGMRRRLEESVGRDLHYFDAARAAAELYLPALVVHDPGDDEVPWAHAQAVAGAWRRSRLVAVHGDGHYRILSSPRAIERALDFAASLPRVASAA